jgi:hypothetical protein
MNVKLVESLVQVIEALSDEERSLLQARLDRRQVWKLNQQRLSTIHKRIRQQKRQHRQDVPVEDLIYEARQQRDEQELSAKLLTGFTF